MITEKKLTAMEEFIDRLKKDFGFVVSNNVTEMYLEKEKKHIIDAYRIGKIEQKENSEQYYNQTFK